MPIERIASFSDLLNLLTETNTPHRADVDRQVVEIPTAVPPLKGPLVARWEKNLPYVQIIHPVVEAVPAARRADVIDAICRANNAIPLPGFGYHYDLHFVYMRLCVPMYEEGMLSTSFRKQLASVVSNAREFAVPFMKIVQGEPGERILELAVAAAAASSS
ncbi:MAG TPA: hypothetical protein VKE22_28200 [Haliangiales bacterium]|nr:hypothetical protein [Haliangiales bacterium]